MPNPSSLYLLCFIILKSLRKESDALITLPYERYCYLEVIHHLWVLQSFLVSIPHKSLNLERKTLVKTSHLELKAPKSLILCILIVILRVNSHILPEEDSLIEIEWCINNYQYSSMSLGVILLRFLQQNNSIMFSPDPMTPQFQVLGHFVNIRYGFCIMK